MIKIFSGSAHQKLAKNVARLAGKPLGKIEISRFPNGEKRIHLLEQLKGDQVFIIQPTIKDEDIIELCLIADAAHRLRAKKVLAVTPWLGYSPQIEVYRSGEPLSIEVMARILFAAGIEGILIIDPHSRKIEKFFKIPLVIASSLDLFVSYLIKINLKKTVVAALDRGDRARSLKLAGQLSLPLVILHKTSRDRQTGQIEFESVKGEVEGKKIIVFDDFISTGQTLIKAAAFLKRKGARQFIACVTHFLPVPGITQKLNQSQIEQILVTDSLPISKERKPLQMKVLSLAPVIAKNLNYLLK